MVLTISGGSDSNEDIANYGLESCSRRIIRGPRMEVSSEERAMSRDVDTTLTFLGKPTSPRGCHFTVHQKVSCVSIADCIIILAYVREMYLLSRRCCGFHLGLKNKF
jgi:hypothetical protein